MNEQVKDWHDFNATFLEMNSKGSCRPDNLGSIFPQHPSKFIKTLPSLPARLVI